jgi:hypothetical protein
MRYFPDLVMHHYPSVPAVFATITRTLTVAPGDSARPTATR